jgi:hypothetical protein
VLVWVPRASYHDSALYQDARFSTIGRFQYGFIAYPLLILGLVGSISTGVVWHVGLALLLFVPLIGICEWRIKRMGFRISDEAIELIRPLNRTRIRWDEIERFDLIVPPGFVDYGYRGVGNRRVGIKRRRRGFIPRSRMQIPTLWITGPAKWPFSPLKGPSALTTSTGERITDVMGFLDDQLASHTTRSFERQAAA